MADQQLSMPFVLAIFVLYIFQIGLINAEGNSTKEVDECQTVGNLALRDRWINKGVVFVCFNDTGTLKWGVVCANYNWDDVGAQVVCRQLGYGGSSEAVQNALYEFTSFASILADGVMDNVKCIGNETRLVDCKHDSCMSSSYARKIAGVKCDAADNDGGFNDFDDNPIDFDDDIWDSGGDDSDGRPDKTSTVIIIAVIATIILAISGVIRCIKRSQLEARQHNQIPNATVQNFQMIPPNHPSNYEVGQHPPPSGAFPNSQQMYPPKGQAGQMMPQGYPNPYPAGAHQHPSPAGMIPPSQPNPYPAGAHQHPSPAGMIPPSQPNPYPTGGPQYPPPDGMMPSFQPNPYQTGGPAQYPPPAQPNPYQAGAQQYPPLPGEVPPFQPLYPSGVQQHPHPSYEGTDLPHCPPPSYDETLKSDNRSE